MPFLSDAIEQIKNAQAQSVLSQKQGKDKFQLLFKKKSSRKIWCITFINFRFLEKSIKDGRFRAISKRKWF